MTTELKNIPAVLFDGYAVLQALNDKAKARTSPENVSDVLDAVVSLLRAESEPSKSETYARNLAMSIWRNHYQLDSPDFELLRDTLGILTQIDNMVSGMTRKDAAPPSAQTGAQDHIADANKMVTQSTDQPNVSKSVGGIDMAQEREAFEKWVRDSGRGFMLKRHDKNDNWYEDLSVTSWWTAWQARAALAAPAQLSDDEIDVQAVRSTKHIGGNLSNSVPFVQVRDFARHLVRALLSAAQGKESE